MMTRRGRHPYGFGGCTAWLLAPGSRSSSLRPPRRLPRYIGGAYCWAGLYMAGELLRSEGFTDVRYVQGDKNVDHSVWIAHGQMDFSINYVPIHLASIEAGVPIKVLGGLHSGCLELIANDNVDSITDLRGERVGILTLDSPQYVLVSLMAAYVGLIPSTTSNGSSKKIILRKASSQENLTHSSASRPVCRNCAPGKSAIRSSTRPSTRRGRSISAA